MPRPIDHLIVLDFEATCDDVNPPSPQEIIEFPSVLLSARTFEVVDEFESFVRPVHHPVLTPFCRELTGIEQPQVDGALPFAEVFPAHQAWLVKHGLPLEAPEPTAEGLPYAFVTCGDWDLKTMLPAQLRACDAVPDEAPAPVPKDSPEHVEGVAVAVAADDEGVAAEAVVYSGDEVPVAQPRLAEVLAASPDAILYLPDEVPEPADPGRYLAGPRPDPTIGAEDLYLFAEGTHTRLFDKLGAQLLAEEFGLPVIDGVAAAVKLVEALVGLGLATSKVGGYAPPLPKPFTGELARFVARKGSITVNGVSLTVNRVTDTPEGAARFEINIIPHTAKVTSFGRLKVGEDVNLEIDMLARYVARLTGAK